LVAKNKMLIVSILLLVLALVALISSADILYLASGNDSEGYAASESYKINSSSNAFALWLSSPVNRAQLKWIVTADDPSKEVFVGWGAENSVEPYLTSFEYETATQWNYYARAFSASLSIPSTVKLRSGTPASLPGAQHVWADQVTTSSSATLHLSPVYSSESKGVLVIMNADGSSGVNATVKFGSKLEIYGLLPFVLIPVGVVLLIVGLLLLLKKNRK
jgi:hypothetical protein